MKKSEWGDPVSVPVENLARCDLLIARLMQELDDAGTLMFRDEMIGMLAALMRARGAYSDSLRGDSL